MVILHIEHPVSNFNFWKKAFDSDPVGRAKSGVKRYQVLRPWDDPKWCCNLMNHSIGLLNDRSLSTKFIFLV